MKKMEYKKIAVEAAKLCRADLKKAFPNTKFYVRSSTSFGGMGCNEINVCYSDYSIDPKVVKDIVFKYCMGHPACDPYNDNAYDAFNYNPEIPQVKYVFVSSMGRYM